MAQRRMVARELAESDVFLDMPLSTQMTYIHFILQSDDDGVVNSPRRILRMIGASNDDMQLLSDNNFIIPINGLIVITHWFRQNKVPNDRYRPTLFKKEISSLIVDDNKMYTFRLQDGDTKTSQGSEEKDSIVKTSEDEGSREQLQHFRGGVLLSENQIESLLNELGLEAFDHYVDKLSVFIRDKNPRIKSHYSTIKKWYEEDSRTV